MEGRAPSAHGHAPEPLAAVIDECLQPDPAARPTLDELMRRLEPVASATA